MSIAPSWSNAMHHVLTISIRHTIHPIFLQFLNIIFCIKILHKMKLMIHFHLVIFHNQIYYHILIIILLFYVHIKKMLIYIIIC
jgi:hypothetical protein